MVIDLGSNFLNKFCPNIVEKSGHPSEICTVLTCPGKFIWDKFFALSFHMIIYHP